MTKFLMKPKVDFAFKEIMMVLLNNDTEIDVEIQLLELEAWPDRSLFYISKMFTEQIETGQKYDVFKKCVSISILDFDLFKDETEFYSSFHIKEDQRNFVYTDKMEFHVIELPKLPKELKENSSNLELWARFINAERKEDFDMVAKQDIYIQSAYDKLKIISQDKKKRLEYEARQKALFDHNQFLYEAEKRGEKKGGEKEKYRTARKLISLGMATDFIMQVTGLSAGIIDGLRS